MPLFVCKKCHHVENTGLTNYFAKELEALERGDTFSPICSECETGEWHGASDLARLPDRDGVAAALDHGPAAAMISDANPCPFCALTLKIADIQAKAKAKRNASGGKCWIKERTQISDETVITILGEIAPYHWQRMVDLLVEIEDYAAREDAGGSPNAATIPRRSPGGSAGSDA